MVNPGITARVEERGHLPGIGVDSGDVGAFVQVAVDAGQGKVRGVVGPAVLLRGDVLDVEGREIMLLAEQAVFTAISSPPPDRGPRRGVHHEGGWRARTRRALALSTLTR